MAETVYLYQLTDKGGMEGLVKYGPSREWTGKNSNFYGTGIYTNIDEKSMITNYHGAVGNVYGSYMMKYILKDGLKDFIVLDEDVRKKYHLEPTYQVLARVLPEDVKRKLRSVAAPREGIHGGQISLYDALCNPKSMRLSYSMHGADRGVNRFNTAAIARQLFLALQGNPIPESEKLPYQKGRRIFDEKDLFRSGIRGFCFTGDNDGHVCVVRDFNSLIPYAYATTFDAQGNPNWKVTLTDEKLKDYESYKDAAFAYKKDYNQTSRTEKEINGFTRVKNNGKFNYVNGQTKELLLPDGCWADQATPFDPVDGIATFYINGEEFVTDGEMFNYGGMPMDRDEFEETVKELGHPTLNEEKIRRINEIIEAKTILQI